VVVAVDAEDAVASGQGPAAHTRSECEYRQEFEK
jgi:hypothetical protein